MSLMQKMFGSSRADVELARNRDKSFANLSAEREKTKQQIAVHEDTLAAIEAEVAPVLQRYQTFVKSGNKVAAQQLLTRLSALDKRIQAERKELQDLRSLDRLAELSMQQRDKQKTTNGVLSALKQVAPYLGNEQAAQQGVIGGEEADEIISRIANSHIQSPDSTISQSLAQHMSALDANASLDAAASSPEASAAETAAMLARLGGDSGGGLSEAEMAADAEAERQAARIIAAAEEADRRRTTTKKNPKVDAAADALLKEAAAAKQKAPTAVKTSKIAVQPQQGYSAADLRGLDSMKVPDDEPIGEAKVAEALMANGKAATRRVRHNFDDE